MAYLNRVQLIGRLGADPEFRTLQNGDKVASLRIATSRKWTDRSTGEKREDTQWHQIEVWPEGLVSLCEKHLWKGMEIFAEGELTTDVWEKDGKKNYRTKIKMSGYTGSIQIIDWNNKDGDGDRGSRRSDSRDDRGARDTRRDPPREQARRPSDDLPDDDIPF